MNRLQFLLFFTILLLGAFLRFYHIERDPPGLYIDEASIGYNAFSILHTGRDEFGVSFPLFFKSFGDYKTPIYIYSVALSMAFFGKNSLAIRFPSALAGTLTLIVFYFFLQKILELNRSKLSKNIRNYLPLLATFLLCISSWHIHFSRGGFEVNLGLFFYLSGSYLILLFWESRKHIYLLSGYLFYIMTMYTYHTFRAPLTWLVVTIIFLIKIPKARKFVITSGLAFILFCMPIFLFSLTPAGSSRFVQTSAFSEYPAQTIAQKIFLYPMVYIKNYLSFFSFDFLFGYGDGNGRHQIPGFGLLFRWQFPFLLIGIGWILKNKKSLLKYVVLGLMFLAPIPASVARPSPHSLRALQLVLPLTIFISIGLILFLQNLKKWKKIAVAVIALVAIYEFTVYLHFYYVHYPNVNSLDWGASDKELVQKITKYKGQYDYLVIDSNLDTAPVYFHLYDNSLKPIYVGSTWTKPKEWKNKHVLYIRPFYVKITDTHIIDTVYLPGNNKDVYAQFWKL